MAWESMTFFICHSNQTRQLIFRNNTKSVKAYLMNISIKSQLLVSEEKILLSIFFFHFFALWFLWQPVQTSSVQKIYGGNKTFQGTFL